MCRTLHNSPSSQTHTHNHLDQARSSDNGRLDVAVMLDLSSTDIAAFIGTIQSAFNTSSSTLQLLRRTSQIPGFKTNLNFAVRDGVEFDSIAAKHSLPKCLAVLLSGEDVCSHHYGDVGDNNYYHNRSHGEGISNVAERKCVCCCEGVASRDGSDICVAIVVVSTVRHVRW